MTKIEDIDIAIKETLQRHPDWAGAAIAASIRADALNTLNPNHYTGLVRYKMKDKDSKDIIEYIVKETIKISLTASKVYNYDKELTDLPLKDKLEEINKRFPNINELGYAYKIITNPKINSILYYEQHPNELFALINAVLSNRFNPEYYPRLQNGVCVPDPRCQALQTREFIDKEAQKNGKIIKALAKVDSDVEKIKVAKKIIVNPAAINRCVRELREGAHLKQKRNNYEVDGVMYATQDIGNKRDNQEDSMLIMNHPENKEFRILAVADGMGGMESGEKASTYTLQELSKWFEKIPVDVYDDPGNVLEAMKAKISAINDDVFRMLRGQGGCTLVCTLVTKDQTYMINVGDSRAYKFTSGRLEQISKDESLVWDEAERKAKSEGRKLTREEIDDLRFQKGSNYIKGSIGTTKLIPEYIQSKVIKNDYEKIFLFSDGITDLLSDDLIEFIATTTPPEYLTTVLVTRALRDNAIRHKKQDEKHYNFIEAGKDNASAVMYTRR